MKAKLYNIFIIAGLFDFFFSSEEPTCKTGTETVHVLGVVILLPVFGNGGGM